MRFFLIGIIPGIILNFFIFRPEPGHEILPRWQGSIESIDAIERSPKYRGSDSARLPVKAGNMIHIVDGAGSALAKADTGESLSSVSGSGLYYAKYEKVGNSVELLGIGGERFWNLKSLEYPHLSYNSKLIFLLNGDQSRARIFDINGADVGAKDISGRLATAIAFSEKNDFGAIGFLSGEYYVIGQLGDVIKEGKAPSGNAVKSAVVSSNGKFAAVHYGGSGPDRVRIINIEKNSDDEYSLKNVYRTRAALHISDDGIAAFMDTNTFTLIRPDGEVLRTVPALTKREGYGSISRSGDLYVAGYTSADGRGVFYLFSLDGTVLMHREFPAESFIQAKIEDGVIFLRGSDNLYCYTARP